MWTICKWSYGKYIFILYLHTPTKVMNRADRNWAHFQKIKYFKNQSYSKTWSLNQIFLKQKKREKTQSLKNDFENQNFEIFQDC